MRAIRKISAIFIRLIPALIACGLIAGINGILTNLGWVPALTPFLGVLSSDFLSLLAVFVGMNAAKEFGGTPVIGAAVGGIIVAAGVANVTVFGENLAPGQCGVLGALAGGILPPTSSGSCAGSRRTPSRSSSCRPSPSWSPARSPSAS